MPDNNIVVAIYETHEEAEKTVRELEQAGFDMKKLSIMARNPHAEEHVVGFYNAGDRIKHWEKGARSGAASGECSSELRSSRFRVLDLCSLPALWWPGSSARWKVPRWSAESALSAQDSSVSAYPKTAFSNTKSPSRRIAFCSSRMEHPKKPLVRGRSSRRHSRPRYTFMQRKQKVNMSRNSRWRRAENLCDKEWFRC
jgi:hypothetical protein